MHASKRQTGLTLVELMVALAIGSFLIIGAVQIYNQSRQAFRVNESIARVQETAQFAMDTIEADLRMASNWGRTSRALAIEGRQFDYKTNERLHKALEAKLFEDQKDSIKLTSLVSNVVDRETQEKIDVVKQRLIKNFGYDEVSATDVLNFVASIFARGDVKE